MAACSMLWAAVQHRGPCRSRCPGAAGAARSGSASLPQAPRLGGALPSWRSEMLRAHLVCFMSYARTSCVSKEPCSFYRRMMSRDPGLGSLHVSLFSRGRGGPRSRQSSEPGAPQSSGAAFPTHTRAGPPRTPLFLKLLSSRCAGLRHQ